jgi:hypothetical protein
MSSRVNIYSHYGKWLTEVDATFNRSWKLNDYGPATFTLSMQDAKCREDYLQFGNFVYVEHEKLPVWAGMIDTPRTWGHGSVTSTVYSAEYLLTCLITTRSTSAQGSHGAVFQALIEQTFNNDVGDIIKIGDIYGGGKSIKRTYYYNTLLDEIKKLCIDSGNDFDLQPEIDQNGRLFFSANWYEKRGMLKPFTLYDDINIKLSNTPLREQGRIGNKLRIYTTGATYESRGVAWRDDLVSVSKYGQRYLAQLQQGNDLNANADALLVEHTYPRKTFDMTAIDSGDTYYQMRIGDQFPISCHSVGFSGSGFGVDEIVRVLQMRYEEDKNELVIVADQVK